MDEYDGFEKWVTNGSENSNFAILGKGEGHVWLGHEFHLDQSHVRGCMRTSQAILKS